MNTGGQARENRHVRVEDQAVGEFSTRPLSWAAKGFPLDGRFASIPDLIGEKLKFTDCGFTTPFPTLSKSALDHNLKTMAEFCQTASVLLAPHGKTTMSPQLFAKQIAQGAWGITVATPWQARVCREFGIQNIVLASQIVDVEAAKWVAEEFSGESDQLISWVDSAEQIDYLSRAAKKWTQASRPFDVLIEIGYEGGRTGCRTDQQIEEVVAAVSSSPYFRLIGVSGYEGLIGHDDSPDTLNSVRKYLRRLRSVAEKLDADGAFVDTERVVISAGGSAYFDIVVEILSGSLPAHRAQVDIVLRSGGYVSHDDQLYGEVSPFRRGSNVLVPRAEFQQAITVWASVLSRPERNLVILNAGKRDVPTDSGNPRPVSVIRDGRHIDGLVSAQWEIVGTNDQHAYLQVPDNSAIRVGDLVGMQISHPCTFFDKWDFIPILDDDDRVVEVINTIF